MPRAALLHVRTDDVPASTCILHEIARGDAGAHEDRERAGLGDLVDVARKRWRARGRARDDDPVGRKELRRVGRLGEGDVGRDGVRRVLLLDVGVHPHVFGADGAAVAEERPGARLEQAFVGHVRERERLDTHELGPGAERHGEGFAVRRREHLDTEGEVDRAPHLTHHGGHPGDDLGPDLALHVGAIVHVLDEERRVTGVTVDSRLRDGPLDDGADRVARVDRPWHGAGVDHAHEGATATEEELETRAKWEADYAARRKAAAAKKQPPPIEFPPYSPYYDWADRIQSSWRTAHDRFAIIPGLSEDQLKTAAEALDFRRQQLADYLASQTEAIAEWEHELYRLGEMEKDSGSVSLPFLGTRIQEKTTETKAATGAWIAQVKAIEEGYLADLRGIVTDEQLEDAATSQALDEALANESAEKVNKINVVVTAVIIGSGVLLMLGLFTRVACIGAAGFLLSVIASQPPWVAGSQNPVFYYQLVEIAALAVLFAAAAGQYAGLDYFIRLFTGKCCGRKEPV